MTRDLSPSEECVIHEGSNTSIDILVVSKEGGLPNGLKPENREKALSYLLSTPRAEPQAWGHLRGDSADHDRATVSTSEALKRQHCVRLGQMAFNAHERKPVISRWKVWASQRR